jgi:hypothetical protein
MAVSILQARPEFVEFCMSEYNYGTIAKWFYSQLPRPHMLPRSMLADEEDNMQIWIDLSDHRDRRPILAGAVPVPGWAVPDVRVLQGVPLGTLPSLQKNLALPGTFDALERLCTDWCDSNLRETYLSTLPYYIRLAMFDGFSILRNVYWTAYDCTRRTKALRMRDQGLRNRIRHLTLD